MQLSDTQNYIKNMDVLLRGDLVLSKDTVLARSSLSIVLKKTDYLYKLQNALSLQAETLQWFKDLVAALDSCFHRNERYLAYKQHILDIFSNSSQLNKSSSFIYQTAPSLFGVQTQIDRKLQDENLMSQIRDIISEIVSVVNDMKSAVGMDDTKPAHQASPTSVSEASVAQSDGSNTATNNNKVFIVHGHNEGMRESVARFIGNCKLEPVILNEKANKGNALIEKFEENSEVGYAVVLCSGDDKGYPKDHPDKERFRARQNVIFELGYFFARLGRGHVAVLFEEGVDIEIPSDIAGIAYIGYDKRGAWRLELARELEARSYVIDKASLI